MSVYVHGGEGGGGEGGDCGGEGATSGRTAMVGGRSVLSSSVIPGQSWKGYSVLLMTFATEATTASAAPALPTTRIEASIAISGIPVDAFSSDGSDERVVTLPKVTLTSR